MSKPSDIKKMAQTVESELERKKVEKLRNHEFNNQGKLLMIFKVYCYREEHRDQQSELDTLEQTSRHFSWQMGK